MTCQESTEQCVNISSVKSALNCSIYFLESFIVFWSTWTGNIYQKFNTHYDDIIVITFILV